MLKLFIGITYRSTVNHYRFVKCLSEFLKMKLFAEVNDKGTYLLGFRYLKEL